MSIMRTDRDPAPFGRKTRAGVLGLGGFTKLIELFVIWHGRASARRQLRMLCELDDHLLKDIGLIRSEMRREAMRPFWLAGGPVAQTFRGTPPRRDGA